ncbi:MULTISPECIES: hypothetical protein [unclassified Rathayibacter]|uniref:hypothetical protein n=1 Tax=unclassified Rathayibacter TaxID=2609250 RepID=UPI0006FD0C42|nr:MULTISPECIES: hypothetical protein [unclassified Rathayibacter]KQQ01407.1 hypothetical protein ASF42_13080 [Rathayibacter sp. Leaf294]KQS11438.1 hypothetical protein ASG06_13080 [Rathayibacter sp. Leaf185]
MDIPSDPGFSGTFGVIATIFPIFFVAVIVIIVVIIVANVRRAKKLGVNPLTLQTDVAARFAQGGLAADRPLADRLAELESLRAAGTISEAEYAAARTAALGGS